jgi:hypothetical protein
MEMSRLTTELRSEYNKKLLEAAKKSFDEKLPIEIVADEVGVHRSIITYARLVHLFGSQEEKDGASSGAKSIQAIGLLIRQRLTPEQQNVLRSRPGKKSPKVLDKTQLEMTLWSKLKPSLTNLSTMPDAASVVEVVKANRGRTVSTQDNLLQALKWLEEFNDAWNQWGRTEPQSDHVDSGRGNGASGAQHTKSAA